MYERVHVTTRPGNFRTQSGEGLDEDGGLDGHVQATGDPGTLQRLVVGILRPGSHKTGHFVLGELDLSAPEGCQRL